jgi:hypothetical protein
MSTSLNYTCRSQNTHTQIIHSLNYTSFYDDSLQLNFDYTDLSLSTTDWRLLHTDSIQLGRSTDIASERTRQKHRLRHLFYCRVTYNVVITQASHWSAGHCPAENGLLLLRNRYCCLTSPAHAPYSITSHACADTKETLPQYCCVILLEYHVTATQAVHGLPATVPQCLEQIRHSINVNLNINFKSNILAGYSFNNMSLRQM